MVSILLEMNTVIQQYKLKLNAFDAYGKVRIRLKLGSELVPL